MRQLVDDVAAHPNDRQRYAESSGAPLSIVFVIPGYPPVLGGAEMHASRLAAALSRRGHRVEVLTMASPPMPNEANWRDDAGIPVRALGVHWPASLRPRVFVLGVGLRLLSRRYDVMQVFLSGLHQVTALAAGAMRGVPAAVMFGGPGQTVAVANARLGRLQLLAIRRLARRVVVLNTAMRQQFESIGVEPARIVSHPCSVDPDAFAPVTESRRRELRIAQSLPLDAPVVAYTGRLVAEKSLPTLIDAFAIVRRTMPNAVLSLVGDGPLRAELERHAEHLLGAGVARFMGTLPPVRVREHLQSADAFAFLSANEGIPCSVIEAMSCACACVVSDDPGVSQLVEDDVQGLVVPTGDAQATAHALVKILTDRPLAHRLGAAARARAIGSFSSDLVAANHERMYREMMESRA